MEELDFNNIETPVDFDVSEQEDFTTEQENTENTENVSADTLFTDDSESVGVRRNIQDSEDPFSPTETGDSSADFYSSIASALRDDGVLEYLDDDTIASITDADSFKDAMEIEKRGQFSLAQRELYDALGYGADVRGLADLQRRYTELSQITPEMLSSDSDKDAENTRKGLIYMEYLERGFSEDKAVREVEKSFNAGTDIEDAQDALDFLKNKVTDVYNAEIDRARQAEEYRRQSIDRQWTNLYNSILNTEELAEGFTLDKKTRNRIVDNVGRPSVPTKDGRYLSKLQAFQEAYPNEFLQIVGTLFTVTDGFSNFNKLVDRISKKERKNSVRDLEKVLKQQNNYGANPRYVSNGRGETAVDNSRYTLNI